jgi:predicted HTH domain antitoxin
MMTVKLEISEDLLNEFNIKDTDDLKKIIEKGIKQMKLEKALQSLKEGEISIARAAELADISLREMIFQATARGLKPAYDKEMMEEEIR